MTILLSIVLTTILFLIEKRFASPSIARGGDDDRFQHLPLQKISNHEGEWSPFLDSSEGRDLSEDLMEEKKNGRRNFMYIGKRNMQDNRRKLGEHSENQQRRSRIYIGKRSDIDAYEVDGIDGKQLEDTSVKFEAYPEGEELTRKMMSDNYFNKKRSARLYIG